MERSQKKRRIETLLSGSPQPLSNSKEVVELKGQMEHMFQEMCRMIGALHQSILELNQRIDRIENELQTKREFQMSYIS